MNDTQFTTPGLEPYLVLGQELFRRVYSEDSPEEINSWLAAQIQRLAGAATESARMSWEQSFDVYEQIMAKRREMAALPEHMRRVLPWPWSSWSNLLDPLEPGMLALIAAADGAGKTIYAECIAEHWARCGRNVVFVHFELNRAIMLDRRTARHTGIPRRTLKAGELTQAQEVERQRSNDAMKTWRGGITYVHTPGWTTEKMIGEVRALIAEGLCDVFVVDYLEKAAASPRQLKLFATNIYAREADDVEQIKSFSEQLEVPVTLLAQLNKLGKGQSFDNLDRTAIRGAGEKTEKANVVILLHRDSLESQDVSVRIDKNTIGPTGTFKQYMDTPRFSVADVTEVAL
jgi:replicative DNA helicase